MLKIRTLLIYLFFLAILSGSTGHANDCRSNETVDHSIYADLLKNHVKNGMVDYKGFKNNEGRLNRYLDILEKTDTKALSRNEQFAFYINAYNAWTLKLILGGYPGLKSIKDLGDIFKSPWKKEICRLDGDVFSLDHIEHAILRPFYKDPRVHFAINCASKSCPLLLSKPYVGITLDKQLEEAAVGFINNPSYNYLKGNTLYVSKIFEWFGSDFSNDIIGYVQKYAREDLKKALNNKENKIKVKYLDYDWSLNGK